MAPTEEKLGSQMKSIVVFAEPEEKERRNPFSFPARGETLHCAP